MITPDYEMFMRILFAMFILRGASLFILGIANIEQDHRDRYGVPEILFGIVLLLLALWVVL